MPAYADRVFETISVAAGTGPITLGGAPTGARTFADAFPDRPIFVGYALEDSTSSAWEVGKGTLNSTGTILTRDVIRSSSNGGLPITVDTGSSIVCTFSSEQIDNANIGLQVAQFNGLAMP